MKDKDDNEFCKHHNIEELDQSVNIKRIRCKDCGKYKCLECDEFFIDNEIPFSKLRLNFCSAECALTSMKREEQNAKQR